MPTAKKYLYPCFLLNKTESLLDRFVFLAIPASVQLSKQVVASCKVVVRATKTDLSNFRV